MLENSAFYLLIGYNLGNWILPQKYRTSLPSDSFDLDKLTVTVNKTKTGLNKLTAIQHSHFIQLQGVVGLLCYVWLTPDVKTSLFPGCFPSGEEEDKQKLVGHG